MKNLILLSVLIFHATAALASDKDVLRDACSAIKAAPKRAECFNALERLVPTTSAVAAAVTNSSQPKLNVRAFGECAQLEYPEIDSMPRDELEGLFCSYAAGSDSMSRTTDESLAKLSDPRMRAVLLGDKVRNLQRCSSGMTKALEAFKRKFPQDRPSCTSLDAKLAAMRQAKLEENSSGK